MSKFKTFIGTTFLGGFAVVLPMVIFIIIVKWVVGFIGGQLDPITALFPVEWDETLIKIIAFAFVVLMCFIVGLMVRTQIGKNLFSFVENQWLGKLPLYKTIKETVSQFFGDNKTAFKQVVLVKPFNSEAKMIGFVTDVKDDFYTVFVPTAPNPTNGYVFVVSKNEVELLDTRSEAAMKAILGLGTGMGKILKVQDQNPLSETE